MWMPVADHSRADPVFPTSSDHDTHVIESFFPFPATTGPVACIIACHDLLSLHMAIGPTSRVEKNIWIAAGDGDLARVQVREVYDVNQVCGLTEDRHIGVDRARCVRVIADMLALLIELPTLYRHVGQRSRSVHVHTHVSLHISS
jgi:hypothetical protein